MKTFFTGLLTILMLVVLSEASLASEKTIKVIWPYSNAGIQATWIRAIIDQANQDQKKYKFVYEHKPGGSGGLAAQYVKKNAAENNTIFGVSSAIFIRTMLYPTTTPYIIDEFKTISVTGSTPMVILTKNRTLEQLLAKDGEITIGTSGAGNTTHLVGELFAKNYPNKKFKFIHYSSGSTEAYKDVMGGHIDASMEFFGDLRDPLNTHIIGITGSKVVQPGVPRFIDLGIKGMDKASVPFMFIAPVQFSDAVAFEINEIFLKAEKGERASNVLKMAHVSRDKEYRTKDELAKWQAEVVDFYRTLSKGIVLE
jgi:tripartite-type tricarboxylate transporter receptor subunit TctC